MAWRKSSPELIAAFDAALPDDRRVQRRKMFGYPCAFTGGNMFTGLHQENLIVRGRWLGKFVSKEAAGAAVLAK